ncbi:MAG: 5-formyltetrahydrofolate cyclo-ligase [Lapillicoccus sp.]
MTAEATSTAKADLRREVRERRRARADAAPPGERHAQAALLADALVAGLRRHVGPGVCRVAAYEARRTEPPTDVLVDRLTALGYDVVVPVTLPDRDLDWRAAGAPDGMALGVETVASVAVVVVPALAVDLAGHRLGQGGGSYDRALPRRAAGALVVAMLHDDELLPAGTVPVDAHDVGVDAVVTPGRGWVSLSRGG